MPARCFILTYCPSPAELYGNLLAIESFRTGFPSASLHVVDNYSHPSVHAQLQAAVEAAGGSIQFSPPTTPALYIQWVLRVSQGETWIVDPDVIFWDEIPSPEAVCGRLLPAFNDPYTGCYTLPRLHTSLLGFPDAAAWREQFRVLSALYFDISLAPRMWLDPDRGWCRQDTAAILLALPHAPFGEEELDRYDHLFCGTHLKLVAGALPALVESHEAAKCGELQALKGLWRKQEAFFQARA